LFESFEDTLCERKKKYSVILIIFLVKYLKREPKMEVKDSNRDCSKQEKQEHKRRERRGILIRQGRKRTIWQGKLCFPTWTAGFGWYR